MPEQRDDGTPELQRGGGVTLQHLGLTLETKMNREV